MEEQLSFIEKHPRLVFWLRFAGWVLFGAVLPFLFIALRFSLFKKMSGFALNGWGILAVIIVAVFFLYLVRCVRKGFSHKNIFVTQCINGLCRVIIPLIGIYAIIKISIANLNLFLEALGCVILCEACAIPLNPMPMWIDKCRKERNEDESKDTIDYLAERIFTKKEKKEK